MRLNLSILVAAAIALMSYPAVAGSSRADSGAVATSNSSANAQAGAGASAGAFGQGGNVSNTYQNRVPGSVAAPGLAAGGNACLGSASAGASFYGGGFGFGATYLEKACESRILADQLMRYGMKKQAMAILWYNHPLVISTAKRGGFGSETASAARAGRPAPGSNKYAPRLGYKADKFAKAKTSKTYASVSKRPSQKPVYKKRIVASVD